MPYRDVAALIDDADRRETQAFRDSENLAMLVDRLDFLNTFGYVGDTTDPDDPEVKRERAERKRRGLKPPPVPLLPPVAQRDPELTAALVERYRSDSAAYQLPKRTTRVEQPPPGQKLATVLRMFEGRG
ncbi:hypothetical protein [Nocardia wallacei]|uniref:hypothetical protein n=1 Tax=Nocardia wallacei TaxID=480035 RepID=UPI002457DD58|nr:hypothetical protein [Nocardia wallacei]